MINWISRHRLLLFTSISLWSSIAVISAQRDTSLLLLPVEVTAQRMDFSDIGKHSDQIDTAVWTKLRYQTLATMLADQTPLYLKNYGNGTLATLGIRGGSASHTQIVWNGIPIRNPMLGLVDLALIPAWLIDNATIHYGGHGAAFGSGAIGGLISISNVQLKEQGVQLHLSAGSWSQRSGELKLNYGSGNWKFSTRAFSRFAENNFNYIPLNGLVAKQQVHHRLKDNGLLQEINLKLNAKNNLTSRIWYQFTDRQIPPTAVQTTSKAAEQDDNLRATLEWQHLGNKIKFQLKAAWLDEKINYQDSLILLYTHNRFKTVLSEAQVSFVPFENVSLAGGLYSERVGATSDNYRDEVERYQHAIFSTARWVQPNWLWRVQARQELTDNQWSPLLIDFSTEWSGIKSLLVKASVSRNYRNPTLNDLSWSPGGNPDLLPEKGWTAESGISIKSKVRSLQFTSSVTGYSRKIDQWIMWMPPIKDIRNFWSPINIAEVNSSGMEARLEMETIKTNWAISFTSGLDLSWSTFGTDIPDFQIKRGEQLFYVPVATFSAQTHISYRHWDLYYQHYVFGASTGINEDVKGGNVGGAGVGYQFARSGMGVALHLEVDNVWNVPYRLIERRPMPGRGVNLGIQISL